MTLQETIQKIKRRLQYGDLRAICDTAGYSTSTFYSACKRSDWPELKDGEIAVINKAIEYFAGKDKEREYVKENAANL